MVCWAIVGIWRLLHNMALFANNYVLVEYSYLLGEKNPEMAIVCDSEWWCFLIVRARLLKHGSLLLLGS